MNKDIGVDTVLDRRLTQFVIKNPGNLSVGFPDCPYKEDPFYNTYLEHVYRAVLTDVFTFKTPHSKCMTVRKHTGEKVYDRHPTAYISTAPSSATNPPYLYYTFMPPPLPFVTMPRHQFPDTPSNPNYPLTPTSAIRSLLDRENYRATIRSPSHTQRLPQEGAVPIQDIVEQIRRVPIPNILTGRADRFIPAGQPEDELLHASDLAHKTTSPPFLRYETNQTQNQTYEFNRIKQKQITVDPKIGITADNLNMARANNLELPCSENDIKNFEDIQISSMKADFLPNETILTEKFGALG